MPHFSKDNVPTIEMNDLPGFEGKTITMELRLAWDGVETPIAKVVDRTVILGYLLHDDDASNPMDISDANGSIIFWDGSGDRDQDNHEYAKSYEVRSELGLISNDGYVDREDDYIPDTDRTFHLNGQQTCLFDLARDAFMDKLNKQPELVRDYLEAHGISIGDRSYAEWLSYGHNAELITTDIGDCNGVFFEEVETAARELYRLHWKLFVSPGIVIITPNVMRDELFITVHDSLDAWDGDWKDTSAYPSLWVPDKLALENLTDGGKPVDHDGAVAYAKGVCDEYVKYANGDVWGCITVVGTMDKYDCQARIPFDSAENADGECWGFIGHDYAKEELEGVIDSIYKKLAGEDE